MDHLGSSSEREDSTDSVEAYGSIGRARTKSRLSFARLGLCATLLALVVAESTILLWPLKEHVSILLANPVPLCS